MNSERNVRTGNGIRIARRDTRIAISQGGVRIRHEDKPVHAGGYRGTLDLLLIFDTTGSMYSYLSIVRENIVKIVQEIHREMPQARVAIMAHGDHCDEKITYLVKRCLFTTNTHDLVSFVRTVEPTDGGDFPEAIEDALWEANQLAWRDTSSKAIVLIGDSYPHTTSECPYKRDYKVESNKLKQKGIRIYSVWCPSQLRDNDVFNWLSTMSGGKFLHLSNINDLCDLLIAIAMKEGGKLVSFERRLKEENRLTDSKLLLLQLLSSDHNEGGGQRD